MIMVWGFNRSMVIMPSCNGTCSLLNAISMHQAGSDSEKPRGKKPFVLHDAILFLKSLWNFESSVERDLSMFEPSL